MKINELRREWEKEEHYAFKGWDFSHLKGRWQDEKLPWNYKEIIFDYLNKTSHLLDMGTGGGEFLLTLNHPYHLTAVTEGYEPNVRLCEEKLSPLGIEVKQVYEDNKLPFKDEAFDLILNRHESFETDEVKRILKKGGYFITQQVGGKNDSDLSEALIQDFKPKYKEHDLRHNVKLLKAQGFEIVKAEESFSPVRFYDIGALVYFAKIIEWEFPGFSVERCFKALCSLQEELEAKGYIEGTEHRFLIVAKNQAAPL